MLFVSYSHMSTFVARYRDMLDKIISSKTRLKLLLRFFVSATSSGHMRGVAQEFDDSTNAIRKELNQLSDAGYLHREKQQNRIVYRANTANPLFKPIQHLLHSFLGVDQWVEQILTRVGDVQQISLVGDYARGLEGKHIEALVLGEHIDREYVEKLATKVSGQIDKDIKIWYEDHEDLRPRIILFNSD